MPSWQRQLLLEALRLELEVEPGEALQQAGAQAGADLGQRGAYLADQGGNAVAAFRQGGSQVFALSPARGIQRLQRLVEHLRGQLGQRLDVALVFAHHPGPAQDLHGAGQGQVTAALAHPVRRFDHARREVEIQRQLAPGVRVPAQAQAGIHLAPFQARADLLAEATFERAQLFRQAQSDFQVTMVYGAQFPGERAPGRVALDAGETRHAADHGCISLAR